MTASLPKQRLLCVAVVCFCLRLQLPETTAFNLPSSRISVPFRHVSVAELLQPAWKLPGTSTSLFMAKARQAKKQQKIEKSRPKKFYDAIEEAGGVEGNKKKNTFDDIDTVVSGEDEAQEGEKAEERSKDAPVDKVKKQTDELPEILTVYTDEATGMEVIQQGKRVTDVVTREAVRLSDLGPEYRLAQLFPGVPMATRQKYRLDWNTVEVPEIVERLRKACSVKLEDGTRGIPPHPSVANSGIDFILSNYDRLGKEMERTIATLTMRSFSLGNDEEGKELRKLWKNYLTLTNHISAPFRQMVLDAEVRIGPNFGSLDVKTFCDGELYERCANYLVLKGTVAHWEKKVYNAKFVEERSQIDSERDSIYLTLMEEPKRARSNTPVLYSLRQCTQVCVMAQKMAKAFVETPELFNDLPPEIRFLEAALSIKGKTPLRQFMIEEFCPAEEITPTALIEGVRRLLAQLEHMQPDPYLELKHIMFSMLRVMAEGTDDARNPYKDYIYNLDQNGPGYFQTYTLDIDEMSTAAFLDRLYEDTPEESKPSAPLEGFGDFGGFGDFFKGDDSDDSPLGGLFEFLGDRKKPLRTEPSTQEKVYKPYKTPAIRAAGRPHELGWLERLNDSSDGLAFADVRPGRIIVEDE